MSGFGDALRAVQAVLMLREEVRLLKEASQAQSARLTQLADAHAALRDRVARLEGFIEGAAAARAQPPRIEG